MSYTSNIPNLTCLAPTSTVELKNALDSALNNTSGAVIIRVPSINFNDDLNGNIDLKNKQYSIVSCPMIYFDENGDFRTGTAYGEPIVNNIAKGTLFCHAPCMVKAEAYHAVNGYAIDDKRLRVEDWDLWVRMYEKGYRGYNLSEPLYKMRDDRNAYSRRKFKYRINEARVTASAIKKLNLSKKYYIWMLRPIIVGLLPKTVYNFLHKRKLSKR
jgi:glycosyltransferase EpsE